MGMYTELALGVRLKAETPKAIIDTLTYMATEQGEPAVTEHPMFKTERWRWMLRSGGSYYFEAEPVLRWAVDGIGDRHCLTVWTNIKNYSQEWDHFLDWLSPWVEPTWKPLGWIRYEEADLPELIFHRDCKLVAVVVQEVTP